MRRPDAAFSPGPGPVAGVSRRGFLGGLGCLLALPGSALALGDATRLDVAELDLGEGLVRRTQAWTRLLYEVAQTTSVEVNPRTVVLEPDDPALFDHPFAVLTGQSAFSPPSPKAMEQLARYLQYGGFLVVDDVSGAQDSSFDRSVRDLCARLFPTRPLSPLPSDHSLYRSFFLIRRPYGRVALLPYLEGITVGDVAPLVYSRNDLSGALERRPDGGDLYAVSPGGEAQRREAVKLGINLVMYALTSNYKKDIAHVRRLMQDGRLE